jgi:hypothetical protein
MEARSIYDIQLQLATDAEEALAKLVAFMIRNDFSYDPDQSGPEDEADAYSRAVVEAADLLLTASDYRELPRAIICSAIAPSQERQQQQAELRTLAQQYRHAKGSTGCARS